MAELESPPDRPARAEVGFLLGVARIRAMLLRGGIDGALSQAAGLAHLLDEDQLARWVRSPNNELDGRTPLQALADDAMQSRLERAALNAWRQPEPR